MKIGVLGSGDVGKTLGAGFLKHGHSVMMGTSNPVKLADWKQANPAGQVGSFAEAAGFGEVVVLAVKGARASEALKKSGADKLKGKTVIDTTNPIAEAPPQDGVLTFFTNLDRSLMEQLQHEFPGAHFVKAFSCVGHALMVDPRLPGGQPTMFICGDHDTAKKTVTDHLTQFGWDVEDMGKAAAARAIEPLCMLWCIPGFLRNDWVHAFKMQRP
jgi:predicted dinucleotide-binding enzyme